MKVTVARDGKVEVRIGSAPIHHVGFVYRDPGNRWGSITKAGRLASSHRWTRAEAVDALVSRFYPQA